MTVLVIPPLTRLPPNATREERLQAYIGYCQALHDLNPGRYLPLGVVRKWYHLKQEHPLTDLEQQKKTLYANYPDPE